MKGNIVVLRQHELVERVKAYDPSADEVLLNRAYVFAMKAHGEQKRASGDPYFSHPVEVAGLLSEKRLDTSSIITGLLHDTVEDTKITLEDIESAFNSEVARLVDGVTKLTRIESRSEQGKQAENFRKLVLAMSDDLRVLLVKLADRLHNMRTLHFVKKPEKRRRIAEETMDIYMPLSERLGIRDWRNELEDIAFQTLNPGIHTSIHRRLKKLRAEGGSAVEETASDLRHLMEEHGLKAEVKGREKTPWSIWRKIQNSRLSFNKLHDITAFRIIVDTRRQCYEALGIIHDRYSAVQGRFKDYISMPKPNNYQSIHTCIIGPGNRIVEIQIRTREMHEVAELGVAAHWSYKHREGEAPPVAPIREGRQYRWVRDMLDILSNADHPDEFLEHTRMEMFPDQVFIFTPKGDLRALPRGATPVDFAYAVHTEIGNHCVSAKVNGRIAPLRTVLRNGDQVEISTSKTQTPNPAWESFIKTGKARSGIRRFVRSQKRQQFIALGREIIGKTFEQANCELTEKALKNVTSRFQCDSVEDIYVRTAEGHVAGRDVLRAVYPGVKEQQTNRIKKASLQNIHDLPPHGIPLRGLRDMAVHYAKCCHPLPGDRIVGIVTTGKGVTIHTIDCHTLEAFAGMPERWINTDWETGEAREGRFIGRIGAVIVNQPGSLASITAVISRDGGNIANLKFTRRSHDFFDLAMDVEVRNARQLNNIIAALRATQEVHSAERQRG